MTKIFSNYLETSLPHRISRQVDTGYPLYPQQNLDFLRALFPEPVPTEVYHLQATHLHYTAQKLS